MWHIPLLFPKWMVDDPRDLSKMTYSNNQFRHKLVDLWFGATFWGITVGARFSGIGDTLFHDCEWKCER